LTLADVPPLLDYPNHLARLFVLGFRPGGPGAGAVLYSRAGAIIPNLGARPDGAAAAAAVPGPSSWAGSSSV
jgi:hypothetical protein